MKKVFMSVAVVAMVMATAACGNNNAKKAEAPVEEAAEAVEEVVEAAADSLSSTVEEAAEAAAEAIDNAE